MKSLFVILIFHLPLVLMANDGGFYAGRSFLEIGGGGGFAFGGHVNAMVENESSPPIGYYTLFYGTEEEKAIELLINSGSNPGLDSISFDFLYEYALEDNVGVGLAIHFENFRARDQRFKHRELDAVLDGSKENELWVAVHSLLNPGANFRPVLDRYIEINRAAEYSGVLLKQDVNPYLQLTFFDYVMGYHFIKKGRFDPYCRFILGIGFGQNNSVAHLGLTIGSRLFLNNDFYLLANITGSGYYLNRRNIAIGGSELLTEANGEIGLGFAF